MIDASGDILMNLSLEIMSKRTLFLNPPSYKNFDGGASSR